MFDLMREHKQHRHYRNSEDLVIQLGKPELNNAIQEIEMLRAMTRNIVLEICSRKDYKYLDLHGLTGEEAKEITIYVLNLVKEKLKADKASETLVEIVTGKGIHSRGGRAVILPKIEKLLQTRGYEFKLDNRGGALLTRVKAQ